MSSTESEPPKPEVREFVNEDGNKEKYLYVSYDSASDFVKYRNIPPSIKDILTHGDYISNKDGILK